VSLETLLRLSDTAGDLDGVPIPAEVARELAHDGAWTKWVVESGGGRFLWAGAKTYRPGDELARHIRGRDVTCRTPGCTTRAVHCDLDHAKAFSEGGETVEPNLGDLCGCHHAAKHELGWSYEMLPNGVARWTLPSRRTYDDEPEHYEDDPRLNGASGRSSARSMRSSKPGKHHPHLTPTSRSDDHDQRLGDVAGPEGFGDPGVPGEDDLGGAAEPVRCA
jgi:hypothetical protein